jgi:hypothetical protein
VHCVEQLIVSRKPRDGSFAELEKHLFDRKRLVWNKGLRQVNSIRIDAALAECASTTQGLRANAERFFFGCSRRQGISVGSASCTAARRQLDPIGYRIKPE